jgi:ketosteroid isomerase-like protein
MRESNVTVSDEPFRLITPDVAITDADAVITDAYGPDGKKGPPINVRVTNVWRKTGDSWLIAACRPTLKTTPPPAAPH